ncbi:MAG TPA: hypothetical protein VFY90_06945 [Tepidiformaceae bacterium]|nr:hypothetical protein [Tepidiformaceae bacterium]
MIRLWALRLVAPLAGRFPWAFYPLATAAGWVAWYTRPRERRNIIRNMGPLCEGDAARIKREGIKAYQNVARYWVDLVSLPNRDMSRFEAEHLTIVHAEWLAVLEAPGPIVAVSAHTGNAELAVQALTWRGRPYVALVEALQPPAVADYLQRLRSAPGGSFYHANIEGLKALIGALRRGEMIGMMGDRDLQNTGVCVELAERHVKLPRGPWELARRAGATVVPMFTARKGGSDDFTLYVYEPFKLGCDGETDPVQAGAERFARVLEEHLKREPGQWAVLEDFWRVHGCG